VLAIADATDPVEGGATSIFEFSSCDVKAWIVMT